MPTTKIGICPWCGKATILFFTTGYYKDINGFWTDFICGGCLELGRRMREETEDGKEI